MSPLEQSYRLRFFEPTQTSPAALWAVRQDESVLRAIQSAERRLAVAQAQAVIAGAQQAWRGQR